MLSLSLSLSLTLSLPATLPLPSTLPRRWGWVETHCPQLWDWGVPIRVGGAIRAAQAECPGKLLTRTLGCSELSHSTGRGVGLAPVRALYNLPAWGHFNPLSFFYSSFQNCEEYTFSPGFAIFGGIRIAACSYIFVRVCIFCEFYTLMTMFFCFFYIKHCYHHQTN